MFTSSSSGFLPFEGIVNARDLGGYTMRDGRRLREGLLLRTASLADATDADISQLSRMPVSRVIDFRMEREKVGRTDRMVPGALYDALPVDASGNIEAQATEREKRRFARNGKKFDVKKVIVFVAFNDKAKRVAREMYPILLFDPQCQRQYAHFFRLVLETESGAILYHCTQGKDRTGIASALLLAALGADRETIVADFEATNSVYEDDVRRYSRRVRFWGGKEEEVGVVRSFLGCNTDNFVNALNRVDSEYGSLDAYLQGPLSLTPTDLQTLKNRYLILRSSTLSASM